MALSSNGLGYEIFTLVMLGSIPTRVTISLCSSRNRALSVEDKDVGVKPTGGSMTNARKVYIFFGIKNGWVRFP